MTAKKKTTAGDPPTDKELLDKIKLRQNLLLAAFDLGVRTELCLADREIEVKEVDKRYRERMTGKKAE